MRASVLHRAVATALSPRVQRVAVHFRAIEVAGMIIVFTAAGFELSALRGLDMLKQEYQTRLSSQLQRLDQLKTRTLISPDACAVTQPLLAMSLHQLRYDTQMFRYRAEVGQSPTLRQLEAEVNLLDLTARTSCSQPVALELDRLAEGHRHEVAAASWGKERRRVKHPSHRTPAAAGGRRYGAER